MNALTSKIANYTAEALIELISEVDTQLSNARAEAAKTGNWITANAILDVRLAIIDQMDKVDEMLFDNYQASK